MKDAVARPSEVVRRVREALRRHGMLAGAERVVVAVSGGPDSMALMHLLRRLRGEFAFALHVAHVDHGLHPASLAHAAFVRRVARAWGLPVTTVRVAVREYARRRRLSCEEAARELRYAALARIARRVGASHIAVAHTADDQVETVLMWMLRGAGADRLAGMPASRPLDGLRVVRPLLEVWREELRVYLTAEGVPWRRDPTNRSRRPLRNRIRQVLLPHLAGYNPGVKSVLRRLAEQAADDGVLLQQLANEAWTTCARRRRARPGRAGRAVIAIEVRRFGALPVALQRRVVHRAMVEAGGNIRALSYVHVERIRALIRSGRPGDAADLPDLRAERTPGEVILAAPRSQRGRQMLE